MTVNQRDDMERLRRVRLANVRQELTAPVTAIVGYGEILREAVCELGLDDILPDLDRMLGAARSLHAGVDHLLDLESAPELFTDSNIAEVERRLRHDLRTPMSAIKGYSELVLDDLNGRGGKSVRTDLEIIIAEVSHLLDRLDVIVDFTRREGAEGGLGPALDPAASRMFNGIVRSVRPVDASGPPQAKLTGHILVVDDLPSNRDLLVRRLKRDGHRTTEADGGIAALRAVVGQDFDLILLDVMMPDLNGFDVLTQLKSDQRTRDIPVIMVSALTEMDAVIRCIEEGAEDYLSKPVNSTLLRARIGASLERRSWQTRERQYLDRLEQEKEHYENLLLNILPRHIVGRINGGEELIADRFDEVTVLFADLAGFTEKSSHLSPASVVKYLNHMFSVFDHVVRELGVEKIKMIGDAYMVVAGAPEPQAQHAEIVGELALRMVERAEAVNKAYEMPLQLRIGVHTGPVVGGIIGTHRFLYDVWGDTVNVASRLEATGVPGRIQLSETTARRIADWFEMEERGPVSIKGKGQMTTFFLTGRKPPKGAD